MPQALCKNLYPDLSIMENIEFFARLLGQPREEREWRIARLCSTMEFRSRLDMVHYLPQQ